MGLWGHYQAGGKEHIGESSGFLAGVHGKKETVQSSISQEPGSLGACVGSWILRGSSDFRSQSREMVGISFRVRVEGPSIRVQEFFFFFFFFIKVCFHEHSICRSFILGSGADVCMCMCVCAHVCMVVHGHAVPCGGLGVTLHLFLCLKVNVRSLC